MMRALARLRDQNPDALRLARLASLAARVEPELLRALRVELMDGTDAAAEADLWWSGAVELRAATGIRLSSEALVELRSELGEDAARARKVIKDVHAGAPRLIQLEEELTFETLRGGNVASALEGVLGTLLNDADRAGHVAAWAIAALPRLPQAARDLPVFWSVLFAADAQGRGSASMVDAAPSAAVFVQATQLLPEMPQVGWLQVDAKLNGDELSFSLGQERLKTDDVILARNMHPVLLEVASASGSVIVAVPREGASRPVKVAGTNVQVRSLGGRTHELRLTGATSRAAPWLGNLGEFPWRLWPPGAALSVSFIRGDRALRERILAIASEWSRHAALRFERAAARKKGVIRIAFERGQGSWSRHGTEALEIGLDEPTMNLEVTQSTLDDELRSVVLHEFGHVLGLVNEAQSPHARIAWNAEAAYAWGDSNGMDREAIDESLLGTYTRPHSHGYREFDPHSVMLNPVSAEFTLDGFSSRSATRLSESDMTFARRLYPQPKPYPMRLPEDGKTEPGRTTLSGRRALEISGKGFPGRPLQLETVSEAELWLQFHDHHVVAGPGLNLVDVDDDERPIVIAAREPFAEAKLSLRFETGRGSEEAPSNAAGLNILRRRLRQSGIPARQKYDQPLFGVWQLDDFGAQKRSPQAIELIAEVLRRFDLTLIDGVHDEFEIDRVLAVLGPTWRQFVAPFRSSRSARPVVVYDGSAVKPIEYTESPFEERRSRLEPHLAGVFEAGGIRLRVIHVEPSPRESSESSESIARSLIELLRPERRDPRPVYELTLVAGFMGIEGPESSALNLLAEADIEIPGPLTRHGDNPALDQIAIYPKSHFITGTAGLVDLYQNSPRALFSGSEVTNEEAVAQLSLRSPAWALVVRPP